MRITARGWRRDHGATDIVDADLSTIPAMEAAFKYGPNDPKIKINRGGLVKRINGVTVYAFSNMRFTGDYGITVHLDKDEIARLFHLTHETEITALTRAVQFLAPPEEEEEEEDS